MQNHEGEIRIQMEDGGKIIKEQEGDT